MKKIFFLIVTFLFFIDFQIAFGAVTDNVPEQVYSDGKLFGFVSPETIISVVKTFILVTLAISATFIASKLTREKLIGYLEGKLDGKPGSEEIIAVVTRTANITVLAVGGSITLGIMGVDLGIFMGGIGLGLGFTLKTFLVNFISGVIMVVQGTYHVGDLVVVSGETGKIVKINSLFTVVEKLDGLIFYVPNVTFLEEVVSNYDSNNKRRVELSIGVDYSTDLFKAKTVINKVIESFPNILKDPSHSITIENFGDSSIDMSVKFWLKTGDNPVEMKSNVNETINLAFKQADIKIPYPHVTVINKK